MLTAKPYGVNLWLGPQEKSKKNQDISSVQEFLDKKFRKLLGLPLKSASLSEYDTNDLPPQVGCIFGSCITTLVNPRLVITDFPWNRKKRNYN